MIIFRPDILHREDVGKEIRAIEEMIDLILFTQEHT